MAPILQALQDSVDIVKFAERCGMIEENGMKLEPKQEEILRFTGKRQLFVCCRQFGKSTLAALKALHTAVLKAQLVLVLAPTVRQSGEVFQKVKSFYQHCEMNLETVKDTSQELEFKNGGRIVAIPSKEGNVRGFSMPGLIVEDEAGWIPDAVRVAVGPMLARSGGELLLVSTPNGRIGHFFHSWQHSQQKPGDPWVAHRYTADDCPWLHGEFLDNERYDMTEGEFLQEYYCEFQESGSAVFSLKDIEAARARGLSRLGVTEDELGEGNDLYEQLEFIMPDPVTRPARPARQGARGLEISI